MTDHQALLNQHFGFSDFKAGQLAVVEKLLSGHSSLAIFPTGSGKSLCYQYTALQLPHVTLVVSPLLALMKDQLNFLHSKGIAAASIDSSVSHDDIRNIMQLARENKLKILMVSVERFKNERFRHFIQSINVSMLVIDEAHCISEWGHNFRPDYLKLPAYRQALSIPLVLLLTATATRKVKFDMALRFDIPRENIIQTGFYRPNLDLSVTHVNQQQKPESLLGYVRQHQGSGIVYVTLQQSAEQVAGELCRHGIRARAYHAGLEDNVRQSIQTDFMENKFEVVVATIAFGMGIDKSNISYVIHYDLPKSIENYSQEIGRAGRDGKQSYCMVMANLDGIPTVENFIYGDTPDASSIEYVLNTIRDETQAGIWECQIYSLSNASNIRQLPLKTLLVQLEILGILTPQYVYFADIKYKLVLTTEEILARFDPERQMLLGQIFSNTLFKRVWGTLNLDDLRLKYGVERSRVVIALDYLAQKGWIELETKKLTDVFWISSELLADSQLGQNLYSYFHDKEQKEIHRVAQLIRFFELETCLTHALSRYFDDDKSPLECGHCSVCRNKAVKLTHSLQLQPIDKELLIIETKNILNLLKNQTNIDPTIETVCRFFAGISVPMFSQQQIKKQPGFGRWAQIRYAEIHSTLEGVWQVCQ